MSEFQGFGPRLRQRRLAAGLSLAQLAQRTNYSKGHLSRIERGLAAPSSGFVRRCDDILGRAPEPAPPGAESLPGLRGGAGQLGGLPPMTRYFVGRHRELAALEALLAQRSHPPGTAVLCVISGMAGVGKTTLAISAAHRGRDAFPDGCLYLDLHGCTEGVLPVTVPDALDRLLRMLGVPGESIAHHPDDRTEQYRSALMDRHLLLVLDNAADSRQVRPLLPGNPRCPVLVTSRSGLPALDEAHRIRLGPLPPDEATALFTQVTGIGAQQAGRSRPGDLGRIAHLCGGLPLAVRIAATRCAPGGAHTVEELARRLADEYECLSELDDGERSVMASFAVSFDALRAPAQRMFSALGTHPGSDFDASVAATLAGTGRREAERVLEQLVDAHLVMRTQPGRFQMHDLLRAFAAATARQTLTAAERRAAIARAADHYVALADTASRELAPHRYRIPVAPAPVIAVDGLPDVDNYERALAWFTTEQSNLTELVRATAHAQLEARCWQLAYALRDFFFVTKQWDVWIASHREALDAARRLADPQAEALTANNLGLALIETGDLDGATQHYIHAQRLFEQVEDTHGAANALGNQAWVHYYRGEHTQALRHFETALDHYTRTGSRRNAAITLRGIGLTEAELRRYDAAIDHLQAALAILVDLDLRLDAAMALNCLGEAHLRRGDAVSGIPHLRRAAVLSRAAGSRYEEDRARRNLDRAVAALPTTLEPDTEGPATARPAVER
ncbi:ATP-binding protein [Streptomyces sp. NPDC001492]